MSKRRAPSPRLPPLEALVTFFTAAEREIVNQVATLPTPRGASRMLREVRIAAAARARAASQGAQVPNLQRKNP